MLRRLDAPACLYNQLEKKTDPFGKCTTATQVNGKIKKIEKMFSSTSNNKQSTTFHHVEKIENLIETICHNNQPNQTFRIKK
jgi:hypothetical protein